MRAWQINVTRVQDINRIALYFRVFTWYLNSFLPYWHLDWFCKMSVVKFFMIFGYNWWQKFMIYYSVIMYNSSFFSSLFLLFFFGTSAYKNVKSWTGLVRLTSWWGVATEVSWKVTCVYWHTWCHLYLQLFNFPL